MKALYKGFIVSALLSGAFIRKLTEKMLGFGSRNYCDNGFAFSSMDVFYCALVGLGVTGLMGGSLSITPRRHTVRCAQLLRNFDHRSRHQRDSRSGDFDGSNGSTDSDHLRGYHHLLPTLRPVRCGDCCHHHRWRLQGWS